MRASATASGSACRAVPLAHDFGVFRLVEVAIPGPDRAKMEVRFGNGRVRTLLRPRRYGASTGGRGKVFRPENIAEIRPPPSRISLTTTATTCSRISAARNQKA